MTHRGNLSLEVVRGEKRIVTQDYIVSCHSSSFSSSSFRHTAGIVVLFRLGFDKRHLIICMKLGGYEEI